MPESPDRADEKAPEPAKGIGVAWQADASPSRPRVGCPVCGRSIRVRSVGDESGWSCSGGHSGIIG